MTVLKGELAVSQSKNLLRLFKKLKDFAIQMQNVLPSTEIQILAIQTQNNTEDIRQIKQRVDNLTVVPRRLIERRRKKSHIDYKS